MDANERNAKLNWMVNDIYSGDAITRLMSDLNDEAEQSSKKDEKGAQNESKVASEPFGSQDEQAETQEQIRERIDSALTKNRAEYQARKTRAKERYQRRKNRYKNWKKGNLNATILPGQDAILAGANELIRLAEDGIYKFAQLIDDIKDITNNAGLNEVLPELKRAYIKERAKLAIKNPAALSNMSTLDEVNAYILQQTESAAPTADPVGIPMYQKIQDRLNEDSRKIVDRVSSHFDIIVEDGDKVTIYKNLQAIKDSSSEAATKNISDQLSAANTSE